MSTTDSSPPTERLRDGIAWLRTGPRAELITFVVFPVAVVLGSVHWIGLVAGGALAGLTASSFKRALVLGLYVGLAVAAAFLAWLWISGTFSKAIATGQILALSLAVAVVFPVLGASVRGLG